MSTEGEKSDFSKSSQFSYTRQELLRKRPKFKFQATQALELGIRACLRECCRAAGAPFPSETGRTHLRRSLLRKVARRLAEGLTYADLVSAASTAAVFSAAQDRGAAALLIALGQDCAGHLEPVIEPALAEVMGERERLDYEVRLIVRGDVSASDFLRRHPDQTAADLRARLSRLRAERPDLGFAKSSTTSSG